MNPGRPRGALSLPKTLFAILAGTIILSLLFYTFWQRLNRKVEDILKEQFNQQQLQLSLKIVDNVEAYFDYLENELLAYPWRFRLIHPDSPDFNTYMESRFRDMHHLGILEIRLYNQDGQLQRFWKSPDLANLPKPGAKLPKPEAKPPEVEAKLPKPKAILPETVAKPPEAEAKLPAAILTWAHNPKNKDRLYLGKVRRATQPPWEGRLVMPFYASLYASPEASYPYGFLEFLIDPLFIARKVTAGVRSGATGYPWIIDQKGTLLAHFEKDFVGQPALEVRRKRNPKLTFKGLKEIQEKVLKGGEGTGGYVSGWHRQKLGEIPKLAAYAPIHFDKGLIRGVTDVEDPTNNIWGVALAAPVAEVAGQIGEVMHQELFIVALFFLLIILTTAALIAVALSWNKVLAREVKLKTEELVESHERLVQSERFAAVGEAAAYVSHEIKNPLMVIGGLARQVERKVGDEPNAVQKLQIIQNEVLRLETFLGDLRDFTRPAAPAKQQVNINDIIQEVDALMAEQAKSQEVKLVEHLDPNLPPLEADPNQMKQVLLNLLKNALEALDSGGQVILSSGAADHQVWFSVRDTGNGMPQEVLEKIFDPFFTTKEKGTGLGLAVIHKIITDHHGDVSVSSSPDKGTTIRVNLPSAS
jgi:two-component system, NtrC family, sensor histidine kinase HydH